MKITRLSTATIEANYDWVLVRLDGAGGLHGMGEAYMGPGLAAILAEMAPLVAGMDVERPDVLVRRLRASSVHASPGVVWHAIAGIETACFDLLGKHLGRPVCELLGGRYRDRVPVYADCHAGQALDSMTPLLQPRQPAWTDAGAEPDSGSAISLKHHGWDKSDAELPSPADYGQRAAEMVGRGFQTLKFDADIPTPFRTDEYDRGLTRAEIAYVVERLSAVRTAIGPDIGFAVDCHWNYNVADARNLIRALEPLDLLWVEDPLPPECIEPLRELQQGSSTALATGENHYFAGDFGRLLRTGIRILAPDAQKIGLLGTREVARLADSEAAAVAFHNIASPIGFAAAAHAAAASPNFLALEWHGASVSFFDELITEGPLIKEGAVTITGRPGLGVTLNEEVARKYRKPGAPFFD